MHFPRHATIKDPILLTENAKFSSISRHCYHECVCLQSRYTFKNSPNEHFLASIPQSYFTILRPHNKSVHGLKKSTCQGYDSKNTNNNVFFVQRINSSNKDISGKDFTLTILFKYILTYSKLINPTIEFFILCYLQWWVWIMQHSTSIYNYSTN